MYYYLSLKSFSPVVVFSRINGKLTYHVRRMSFRPADVIAADYLVPSLISFFAV